MGIPSVWDNEEARDDTPGGSRVTAIADLARSLTIKWKLGLGLRVCLFKIVHLVGKSQSLQTPD